jgi:phage-related protein
VTPSPEGEPRPKPLVRLGGEIKTPPFSKEARVEAGFLLRRLQDGESLGLPHSRPMPSIGPRCHELRVRDENRIWRVVYRLDPDAIVVAGVFSKTTAATAKHDIEDCQKRLKAYDEAAKKARKRGGP